MRSISSSSFIRFGVGAVVSVLLLMAAAQLSIASPFTGGKRTGAHAPSANDSAAQSSVPSNETRIASGEQLRDGEPPLYTQMLRRITAEQKQLRRKLSRLGRDIQKEPWGTSFWLFIGLSFLYGVVHALGPGHGKSVVFSYFLGKRGSVSKGFAMGHLLSFVHVMSAVAIVLVVHFFIDKGGSQDFDVAGGQLQKASFGLIFLLGTGMTIHALYELITGGARRKVCCSAPALEQDADSASYKGISFVSIITGLVPCPGAALVLSFALSLGIELAGAVAMLAMAIGMGFTTAMFGVLSIISRGALLHVAGCGPRLFITVYGVLSVGSALCIACFGALLFLG